MRKVYLLVFLLVVSLVSAGVAADKAAKEQTFKAKLSGSEAVPPAKTKAGGEATFHHAQNSPEMKYTLTVKDLENATGAHIHEGKKGKNGSPVAPLFSGPKKGTKFSGALAEGKITKKDLTGSLKGKTVDDLVKMIQDGNAYVNVHTDAYPDGELRGQIK